MIRLIKAYGSVGRRAAFKWVEKGKGRQAFYREESTQISVVRWVWPHKTPVEQDGFRVNGVKDGDMGGLWYSPTVSVREAFRRGWAGRIRK